MTANTGVMNPDAGVSPAAAGAAWDRRDAARSAGLFLGAAGVAWIVVAASAAWLPVHRATRARKWNFFPGRPWFGGWVRFDGAWYRDIALHGYWFRAGRQSAVAFFPSYPLLMRAVGVVTGDVLVAGIAITVCAGLGAAVLFERWSSERIGRGAAWTGLVLLLVYPYAFYLYGAVYSDALFLAAAIGAFLLLEHDRPLAAGLVGIIATGARPVGAALVLGLVVRAIELGHAKAATTRLRRWRLHSVGGVLIALAGLGAWCGYLWQRFGNPLAFAAVERGWGQEPGPRTWFKVRFFHDLGHIHRPAHMLVYLAHPAATLLALALVPVVWRRLGRGYGLYTAAVVLMPAMSTSNFWSMGRYALAAFPCFAVAGDLLARRPRWRIGVFIVSAGLMLGLSSLYARGVYIA